MPFKCGNNTVQNYILNYGKKHTVSNYKINDTSVWTSGEGDIDFSEPTDSSYFNFTLLADNTYSIAAKDVTTLPYTVVLPSEYEGKAVTVIAEAGFCDNDVDMSDISTFNSVVANIGIPASITTIKGAAFQNLFSLRKVKLEQGSNLVKMDTSLFRLSGLDFVAQRGALDVDLSGATQLTKIGFNVFYESGLRSITLPDSIVSLNDSAFSGCAHLSEVTLGSAVTSIGAYAFKGCESLGIITIPDSVISIGERAFERCISLIAVNFGENSQLVSFGDYAFSSCYNLRSCSIPNSVTTIGDCAFYNCEHLANVVIPDSVTSIGEEAFYWCDKIYYIIIPKNVSVMGRRVFGGTSVATYYCEATEKPSGWHSEWGTAVPVVWGYVAPLGDDYFTFIEQADGTYSVKATDVSNLPSVVSIPFTYNGKAVTVIDYSAFYGSSNLEKVILPWSITVIDNNAFEECRKLTEINLPESLTTINASAFGYCTILPSITIPSAVTYIGGWAFYNCNALTINCRASSQPSGWESNWNPDNRPVVWGYTG